MKWRWKGIFASFKELGIQDATILPQWEEEAKKQKAHIFLQNNPIPFDKGSLYFQAHGMLFVELKRTEAFVQNHLKPDMSSCVFYPLAL